MPITSFPDYAQAIEDVLASLIVTGEATSIDLKVDQRSSLRGFIMGILQFSDGSELHFREFLDISRDEPRLMYAYHYQSPEKTLIFRYDNAAHRPPLPQPEHKHTKTNVKASSAPTLAQVIDEILMR